MSRSEEVLLLTILKLEDNAYGVSIREQIKNDSGRYWSFASIYTPLEKLTKKRYVEKLKGEPSPERGGKSKYLYRVTSDGKKALLELKAAHEKFWEGVPGLSGK